MTVRVVNGGSDWAYNEKLSSNDINDTFKAVCATGEDEIVTGQYTFSGAITSFHGNIAFDVGSRTFNGIQVQYLPDKHTGESITGAWIFTNSSGIQVKSGISIDTTPGDGSSTGSFQKNETSGELAIISYSNSGSNDIGLYTNSSGTPATRKVWITSDGKFGIGTSPTYTFDVSGQGRFVVSSLNPLYLNRTDSGDDVLDLTTAGTYATILVNGAGKRIRLFNSTDATNAKLQIADPTASTDATTKNYVDGIAYAVYGGYSSDTFGGTGADGALTVSVDTAIAGNRSYNYTSLTVNATKTLSLSSGQMVRIRVSGDCVINGTISLSGRGGAGGLGGARYISGEVGANGATIFNGTITGGTFATDWYYGSGGGGGGGYSGATDGLSYAGGNGIAGSDFNDNFSSLLLAGIIPFYGAGGGGGCLGVTSSHTGGTGGAGGGCLILEVAGNLTISGTLNVSGTNGLASTTGGSEPRASGGGGGGGCLIVLYKGTLTETSPTYNYSGGTGDVLVGGWWHGGDGGTGYFKKLKVTTT